MWFKNKLVISALIFVVLLAIVMMVSESPYETKVESFEGVLPTIEEATLDKIEITQETESFTVERRGEDWLITSPGEYTAESSWKSAVVEKLEGLKISRVASDKKEKHSNFEVDEKGIRVKAFAKGQEVLSVIVGKQTPDYRGTFIRLPDSERVLVVEGAFASSFKKKVKDWRNKFVYDLPKEEFNYIEFAAASSKYAFEKKEIEVKQAAKEGEEAVAPVKETVWKLVGDEKFSVDKTRLESTLNTFAKLRWAEVEDKPKELAFYGLDTADVKVSAKDKDGNSFSFSMKVLPSEKEASGQDKPSQFSWVKTAGSEKVYQIRKYQADKFTKDKAYYNSAGAKK